MTTRQEALVFVAWVLLPCAAPYTYTTGDQVVLATDVTPGSGGLQRKEIGTVVEEAGAQRYRVERASDQTAAWYEADEIVMAAWHGPRTRNPPPPRAGRPSLGDGTCRQLAAFSASVVVASSAARQASTLANKSIVAADLSCHDAAAKLRPWLPDAPGRSWLEAEFGSRYHVKDVMVHKRYPRGLISRIDGIEPRFHGGYKSRTLWVGQDTVGCGTIVAGIPSVPQYSFGKVRVEIEHEASWEWDDTLPHTQSRFGIVALEFLGVSTECFSIFAHETEESALLRKRMEHGYTGCLSSSAPYFLDTEKRLSPSGPICGK